MPLPRFLLRRLQRPFSGNCTQVLNPYGVPLANQNVLSPVEVQQLALSGQTQRVPSAFLLQLPDGKLHIFLQLAKFDARMGLPATPWDNRLYVQKGELFHNQAQLVNWESSYFHQANASLRVQTATATPPLSTWDHMPQPMPILS